jgi:hypothetical protein
MEMVSGILFSFSGVFASGALAMLLADNQWAREHQWLIPVLWSLSGACFIGAILCTKRIRSVFMPREETKREAISLTVRDHGSVPGIGSMGSIAGKATVYIGSIYNAPNAAPIVPERSTPSVENPQEPVSKLGSASPGTARYVNLMGQLQGLISEAETLAANYDRIRQSHPESGPATFPFSVDTDNPKESEAIKLWQTWKSAAKDHMNAINAFCLRTGNPMTTSWPEDNALYGRVAVWSEGSDRLDGPDCSRLLKRHIKRLKRTRDSYAAAFEQDPASAKVTVSWIGC